jgi:hypothetical protein
MFAYLLFLHFQIKNIFEKNSGSTFCMCRSTFYTTYTIRLTVENLRLLYIQIFIQAQPLSCHEHELHYFLSTYGMFHYKKGYMGGTILLPIPALYTLPHFIFNY